MNSVGQLQQILGDIYLFQSLSAEERSKIAARATILTFASGQTIINEGDCGNSMFIIIAGEVQVLTHDECRQPVVLARLENNAFFGEQALLPRSSGKRNASVRALTPLTLAEISQSNFLAVIKRDHSISDKLQIIGKQQLLQKLQHTCVLFRELRLSLDEDCLHMEKFQAGQVVFRRGDPSDKMYFILSGSASVRKRQIIGKLGPNQYFGELSLVEKSPRSASVVADEDLLVLALDGAKFLACYHQSPELQDYIHTITGLYRLPGRGVISLHHGKWLDLPSITAMYHFAGKVRAAFTRIVGRPIYSMSLVGASDGPIQRVVYEDSKHNIFRQIEFLYGRVVSFTVRGEWPALGQLHRDALQSRPFSPWQMTLLQEQGELWLGQELLQGEDSDIICKCASVSRGVLKYAMGSGCDSVDSLALATGASMICGSCAGELAQLVGRSDLQLVECIEILRPSAEIKTIRLRPRQGKVEPFLAGQHILVQARIHEMWLQRAYTLSSPASEDRYYEITVKREQGGVFSNWLHDELNFASLIRISRPRGQFCLQPERCTPLVFFAGGIGITPALSMLRTLKRQEKASHTIYIDYSAPDTTQVIYAHEFDNDPQQFPHIETNLRLTRECGRLQQHQVSTLVERFPQADFFICGSEGYRQSLCRYLHKSQVGAEKIFCEQFTPATPKPASLWQKIVRRKRL